MLGIGVDLGGTKLAAGMVTYDGKMICKKSIPTGKWSPDELLESLVNVIESVASDAGIKLENVGLVGIGVPGSVDMTTGTIEYANNLNLSHLPLEFMLRMRLPGVKCIVLNDADAAAYGEYKFGAGVGAKSMVLITIGTGIGAGIIINEDVYHGVNYAAGELGHMTIKFDGERCGCGRRGCFELYASASALIRQAKEEMEKDPSSMLWQECLGDLERLDGVRFFRCVRAKDETAARVFEQYVEYLSAGVIDVVNLLEPELILIGGGISNEGDFLLDPIRKRVYDENYSRISHRQTRIAAAALGSDAGIIGSAALADRLTMPVY